MGGEGWPSTPFDKLRMAVAAAKPVDWALLAAGLTVLVVSFLPWYHVTVTFDASFDGSFANQDAFGKDNTYSSNGWSGVVAFIPLLALAALGVRLFHLARGGPGVRTAVVSLVLAGLGAVGSGVALLQPARGDEVSAEISGLGTISAEPAIGLFLAPVAAVAQVLVAVLILVKERRQLAALPAEQPLY